MVLYIVLVQMHFIRCKQFSETNVNSHNTLFNKFHIFPECFCGPQKMLWRITCSLQACIWTTAP